MQLLRVRAYAGIERFTGPEERIERFERFEWTDGGGGGMGGRTFRRENKKEKKTIVVKNVL